MNGAWSRNQKSQIWIHKESHEYKENFLRKTRSFDVSGRKLRYQKRERDVIGRKNIVAMKERDKETN